MMNRKCIHPLLFFLFVIVTNHSTRGFFLQFKKSSYDSCSGFSFRLQQLQRQQQQFQTPRSTNPINKQQRSQLRLSPKGSTPTMNFNRRRMGPIISDQVSSSSSHLLPLQAVTPSKQSPPSPPPPPPSSSEELQENPLKTIYSIMLFCFVTYAFTLAPDSSPKDFELIQQIITQPFDGVSNNALFVVLFNALGIIPATLASLLLPGAKKQKIPAFPFVFASFFLGFFAIGPYLALRQWNIDVIEKEKGFGSSLFEFKGTLFILLGYSLYLFYYLFDQFHIHGIENVFFEFWELFKNQQLVNVSSLDFTVLSLSMYDPIREDIERRYKPNGLQSPFPAWSYCVLPVLGPVLYLLIRPSLPKERTVSIN